MSTRNIDLVRTTIWLKEIRQSTGLSTVRSLVDKLDPDSYWQDPHGVLHQSKWYQFQWGKSIPSRALTTQIKRQIPSLTFEIHHPVWTFFRNTSASQRTHERLISKMSTQWRKTYRKLKWNEFGHRRISTDLVQTYELDQISYLDALLLFSLARTWLSSRHPERANNLTFIQLALPLIYVHDPFWSIQDDEIRRSTLLAIEPPISSRKGDQSVCFPAEQLMVGMRLQEKSLSAVIKQRRVLKSSHHAQVNWLSEFLCAEPESAYARALSAFHTESSLAWSFGILFGNDVQYGATEWRKSWSELRTQKIFLNLLCNSKEANQKNISNLGTTTIQRDLKP